MPRRRAFTLIELLVVVGMMTALITIVLPSFQRVRQLAKQAACASNLRQLAAAINAYAGDNKGFLPPHKIDPSVNPRRWWAIDQESRDNGADPQAELFTYADNEALYHCPDLTSESAVAGGAFEWAFTPRDVGYGYNAFFLGWYGGDPTAVLSPGGGITPDLQCNISYFVDGNRTVVFADATVRTSDPQGSYVMWWPTTNIGPSGAYPRHLKRANLVMLGGGVRSLYEEEMQPSSTERALVQIFDPRYPRPGP